MCGRTSLKASPAEIAEAFGLDEEPELTPRYNIAPTQPIPIVVPKPEGAERPGRELHVVRFGLVPFWDKSAGGKHINARMETIFDKRIFAEAVKSRRCLVVVDGFYEWKREGKGASAKSQPYRIHFAGDVPFALAGIYERWSTKDGEVVESCAIITGPSHGVVAELHDRTPLVVPRREADAWLSREADPRAMLDSFAASSPPWVIDAASRYVNNPRNEGPACLEAANDTGDTLSLFSATTSKTPPRSASGS